MSFRPARKIFPPARYTTDNAELELPSCRRAPVPSQPTSTPSMTSSLPPSSSPPPLTDTEDDLPAPRSSKRRLHDPIKSTLSNDSIITVATSADDTDADTPNMAQNPKKAKVNAPGDQGEPSEISVINIDDIQDPDDERLNKSQPTADIKRFFVAHLCPGQTTGKPRMKCTLCA